MSFPSLVAFDLDDTLTESKSPLPPPMTDAITRLLRCVPVAIISGGRFEQFDEQVLRMLPPVAPLGELHILPTCGTRYMRYLDGSWADIYRRDLSHAERSRAIASLTLRAQQLGYWEPDDRVFGDRVEDRGSQVTFSALGQRAAPDIKRAWDPDGAKRHALRDLVAADLPDLEVAAGGSTSIDITQKGVDKAFGIKALAEQTGIPLSAMLFVGDRTEPGGNDYPVVLLGVPTLSVTGWRDTLGVIGDLCDKLEDR